MTKIENAVNERYSPILLLLKENHFQEDQVDFWPLKLTLNTENAQFLSARHYFFLQDIKISFKYVDFHAKLSPSLDTWVRNSTTQWTIIDNHPAIGIRYPSFLHPSWENGTDLESQQHFSALCTRIIYSDSNLRKCDNTKEERKGWFRRGLSPCFVLSSFWGPAVVVRST